jgi:1,4-dihydroxy-2-naphthoate octaprenyltransferase
MNRSVFFDPTSCLVVVFGLGLSMYYQGKMNPSSFALLLVAGVSISIAVAIVEIKERKKS